MATTFKTLSANDIVTTKTLLHEAIPITGTIVSGTYYTGTTEKNIKNYTHGMFQSVYDYPYLSSSANHIFDIAVGFAATSSLSGNSGGHKQVSKKINVYNQMAQVLQGYDDNGNIRRFDEDGNLTGTLTKMDEVYFINFARLLSKDEIKKGSFNLELGVSASWDQQNGVFAQRIKLSDTNAQNDYRVNSPAGDYAILYATEGTSGDILTTDDGTQKAGLIFYQAGIAVIPSTVFKSDHASVTVKATNAPTNGNIITIVAADGSSQAFEVTASTTSATQFSRGGTKHGIDNLKTAIEASSIAAKVVVSSVQTVTGGFMITITQVTAGTTGNKTITNNCTSYSVAGNTAATNGNFAGGGSGGILAQGASLTQMNTGLQNIDQLFVSGAISASCDSLRQRLYNVSFNNTTELNSTVYFCRAHHNEFNYSTNPTYLSGSKLLVKNNASDSPVSYITSVGLYSPDNELLATAKLSEALKKDPSNELTLRVRLDY